MTPQTPQRSTPLVSCLCVTEGRHAFLPWLYWNWAKQDHPAKELVVVGPDLTLTGRPGVVPVLCEPGLPVPVKRNIALDHAQGDLVAWMDDDDWQHPRRLTAMVAALENGPAAVVGGWRSWFVSVATGRCELFEMHRGVLFNNLVARRDRCGRFDEARHVASDTPWMAGLGPTVRVPGVWSMWLCHDRNLSNPASERRLYLPLETAVDDVGADAWADTGARLAALRNRVAVN